MDGFSGDWNSLLLFETCNDFLFGDLYIGNDRALTNIRVDVGVNVQIPTYGFPVIGFSVMICIAGIFRLCFLLYVAIV